MKPSLNPYRMSLTGFVAVTLPNSGTEGNARECLRGFMGLSLVKSMMTLKVANGS